MDYVIGIWWIIPLIFVPFILGLLTGLNVMREKITTKLLESMSIDEFKKLLDE